MRRKIEIGRIVICLFLVILFFKLKLVWFFEPKFGPYLLPISRVYYSHSFLLTLTLKTMTCVMTLLVLAWSKLNPNLIEIKIFCRLLMGFWSYIVYIICSNQESILQCAYGWNDVKSIESHTLPKCVLVHIYFKQHYLYVLLISSCKLPMKCHQHQYEHDIIFIPFNFKN
jgi:hypothetical protein